MGVQDDSQIFCHDPATRTDDELARVQRKPAQWQHGIWNLEKAVDKRRHLGPDGQPCEKGAGDCKERSDQEDTHADYYDRLRTEDRSRDADLIEAASGRRLGVHAVRY